LDSTEKRYISACVQVLAGLRFDKSLITQQIRTLSITQLEELAEALLDFSSQSDLVNYLGNIFLPQPNEED
jgi:Domain of unknown function (DUF4351)